MIKLSPSILSADFSKLGEDVKAIEEGGAHLIHVDVMDGHFVPNISYGATVMKSLLGKTTLPFDVHLMIENPELHMKNFMTSNTEYITVHREACVHLDRTISQIKDLGAKAGVSLNPATPVSSLEPVLSRLELVLIMSVNPGFGGQRFIDYTLSKIHTLDRIRKREGYTYHIQVDGGMDLENLDEVLGAGADIIVAGSSIFKGGDISRRTKEFLKKMNTGSKDEIK